MAEFVWTVQRERVVAACGDVPSAQLEARLIETFTAQPALVVAGIDHVLRKFESGVIRSPWPVLVKHVEDAAARGADVTVRDDSERAKRVGRARQWLRTAGVHFDREAEVADELFGDRGLLYAWRSDEALRDETLSLWRELTSRASEQQLDVDSIDTDNPFLR